MMADLINIDRISLPADIKHVTRRRILEVFKSGEKLTAVDVNAATGISKPTVMRSIQYFCAKGVLASAGLGQASSVGGKKPEYFSFADNRKILCITLWPNGITLSLSGLVGDVYALTSYPRLASDSLEEVFRYLGDISCAFLVKQSVPLLELYGIVLSTSGTVDYKNGLLRYNSQSPHWGADIPVVDYLKPIFGESVEYIIENAGKSTGRAVLLEHPELTQRRVLTIFTTWGVSACLIENGHVLNGKDSLIGEIGHMTIDNGDPAKERCGCGKRGCLERMVNLERVRAMLGDEDITFQALFEASAAGEQAAQRVVRYLAHCFAVALHNLSLVYNPDYVIFQGDFALADAYFDQCLMEELTEFRYYPHDGVFKTYYDTRDLALLAARGGASLIKRHYFASLEE